MEVKTFLPPWFYILEVQSSILYKHFYLFIFLWHNAWYILHIISGLFLPSYPSTKTFMFPGWHLVSMVVYDRLQVFIFLRKINPLCLLIISIEVYGVQGMILSLFLMESSPYCQTPGVSIPGTMHLWYSSRTVYERRIDVRGSKSAKFLNQSTYISPPQPQLFCLFI